MPGVIASANPGMTAGVHRVGRKLPTSARPEVRRANSDPPLKTDTTMNLLRPLALAALAVAGLAGTASAQYPYPQPPLRTFPPAAPVQTHSHSHRTVVIEQPVVVAPPPVVVQRPPVVVER